jgi:hypothetical protein
VVALDGPTRRSARRSRLGQALQRLLERLAAEGQADLGELANGLNRGGEEIAATLA